MKLKSLISEIFRNWTEMTPGYFNKFADNYKKLNKDNRVLVDKSGEEPVYYGTKKGSKTAEWKYIQDEFKIYSDMKDQDIWKLQRGQLKEWHPQVGQIQHKNRYKEDDLNETKMNIDDLDIDKHGAPHSVGKILTVPTNTNPMGLFTNDPGRKELKDWIKTMKSKYGVKQVEVKDGKVIVKSPKLDAELKSYHSGVASTLKRWGTTE